MILTNSYLIALVIPLILLVCGAFAKKLVRGGGWRDSDFFLGVELTLAALGSDMVYFYDLQKIHTISSLSGFPNVDKITITTSFLAITFFLLFLVLSTHQDWEGRNTDRRGQIIWLGVFCNGIGIVLFIAFVLLVKGV